MPDSYWPTTLSVAESYVTGDEPPADSRRDLLHRAAVKLHRVNDQPRWDCAARLTALEAAELLRRAELPELATECEDEFGIDEAAVLREIDAELAQ